MAKKPEYPSVSDHQSARMIVPIEPGGSPTPRDPTPPKPKPTGRAATDPAPRKTDDKKS